MTAYHEGGHALVSLNVPSADPLHKVTIIPRGMALGVTMQLPIDDKHTYTRDYLETRLAIMMGGRVAEELFLNTMTTGAGNDIEQASDLARKMTCEFGMSSLGPITFGKKEEQIFLGREISQHRDFSEETAQKIDAEVRRFVDDGYNSARHILESNRPILETIAMALLEREVIDANEVQLIIEGKELPIKVNPNVPPPAKDDDVQQVLKPAPGQPNVAPGERPAQA
jgi:cell division protease FtsH